MSHDTPDTRLLVHKKCHILSRLHVHQVLGPLGWTPPWVDSIHWIPLMSQSQESRAKNWELRRCMIPLMPGRRCMKSVTCSQVYWVLGPTGWIALRLITLGWISLMPRVENWELRRCMIPPMPGRRCMKPQALLSPDSPLTSCSNMRGWRRRRITVVY